MKKTFHTFILASVSAFSLLSCAKEPALSPESVITVPVQTKNDFDKWLEANYVNPYNIEFKYRYELSETSLSYYTIPADFWSCVQMAHLVKYSCVDSYDEVAGINFTRKYFPKQFYLQGEWQYKNNGSFTLGTAEGGKKIFLMGLNYLSRYINNAEDLNHYYLKTIHHEFTHILNQTKDFPVAFSKISGGTDYPYVTDDCFADQYEDFLIRGFITDYSQKEDREDFAEMMSVYITHTPEWWAEQLTKADEKAPANSKDGKVIGSERIKAKLAIVKEYMKKNFDIDLDELREVVLRRENELVSGEVDLKSLEIN